MEKVIIFGTGGFYRKYASSLNLKEIEIVAFIDNNVDMIGNEIDGKPVLSPSDIINLNYDKVVIMSMFATEMVQQLIILKVQQNKIYVYEEYSNKFKNSWQIFGGLQNDECLQDFDDKKVLLITHELTITGAPMALKYAAQALKEQGYKPILISPKNGPLINEFLKLNIAVVITPVLCMESENFKKIVETSKLIITNTLCLYSVVEKLSNLDIPVMWWLHEGRFSYNIYREKVLKNLGSNIHVYTVGWYAANFWNGLGCNISPRILLYGIPDKSDQYMMTSSEINNKITFCMVGTVEKRKGQDIFVEAIQSISKEYRNKSEFLIIGKTIDLDLKMKISELANNIKEIKFIDEMDNDSLFDIYNKSDVLVSASRDDPMPIVLTEGMMMGKPCICSSNTGTASLIENWENGVVFHSEDYIELGKIMKKIIDQPIITRNMGKNARIKYEKTFMYSTFKKHLLSEIEDILN